MSKFIVVKEPTKKIDGEAKPLHERLQYIKDVAGIEIKTRDKAWEDASTAVIVALYKDGHDQGSIENILGEISNYWRAIGRNEFASLVNKYLGE